MPSSSRDTYSQWTDTQDEDVTLDVVDDLLTPCNDDLWVVAACVDRLLHNVQVQRRLLQLGIQRTEAASERSQKAASSKELQPETSQDGKEIPRAGFSAEPTVESLSAYFHDSPTDAQLCWLRSVLLERSDRLNTYEELLNMSPAPKEDEDEGEDWDDDPWAENDTSSDSPKLQTSTATSFPISLPAFLVEDISRIACLLATQQWYEALYRLRVRHADVFWPHRFTILECIPAHVHPSAYRDMLPSVDPASDMELYYSKECWRLAQDWTETPLALSAIKNSADVDTTLALAPVPERSMALRSLNPLTANELLQWYKHRIEFITGSAGGLLDVALALAQHAASQGIPGLDELGEELSLLSRLVYDAPQPFHGDDEYDWSLSRWRSMNPSEVVQAYLKYSTEESVAKDLSSLVMPYLYVMESRAERSGKPDPGLPIRLLYEYILSAPLNLVSAIFESSKPTLPIAQRVIRNDEDAARLALACLYGSDSLDDWPTMSRIFECMPAWDDSETDEDVTDTTMASLGACVTPTTSNPTPAPSDLYLFFKPLPASSLSRALDILDVHLEAGEIMARWGVPSPLRWFLQSHDDVAQQRSWATRMARRAGQASHPLETKDDWEWLLEDMLKLTNVADNGVRGAFGLLSRNEVIRIFLGGLLSSGYLDIARELLGRMQDKSLVDSQVIEDICMACSNEFYDNASSGNYKFGDMKLAYECLDLPAQSARVLQEKEFIEATSRLSSFNISSRPGIPISPLEIRLTSDRLSLVAQVLTANADAYKHVEVILELVHKLGFRNDPVAEVRALAMLTDTALQAEDFTRAYETSERMVHIVHEFMRSSPLAREDPRVATATEVCWVACYQLGRQPEFDDTEKKLTLLGRALDLAPNDKLHDILLSWRRLEKEDIEARQERLSNQSSNPMTPASRAPSMATNPAASLRAKLQHFHMPTPPLLSTPDAAALASRTFRSVAATFPFSVGSRGRSQASNHDDGLSSRSGSQRPDDDVSAQASRVLSKGIGWLIGADDE
ncbi:hypothetical protein ONZ45_g3031 [Pleurotus djamor]|nr:hypothetical protein ONZ45_g3031 [Pleurotus djamor]